MFNFYTMLISHYSCDANLDKTIAALPFDYDIILSYLVRFKLP